MKELLTDANFPKDADGRTYHLNTKQGEVANRIVVVGDFVRARRIAAHFDGGRPLFEHVSQRNFLTLTGVYKGIPLTIVAIGMGFSVVDFFVRECRAVVEGDMIIVRVGSCGSVKEDLTVGTIAVPEAAVAITRIYDHFHPSTFAEQDAPDALQGYSVTKPLPAGTRVHQALMDALRATCPQASKGLFQGQRPKMCGEGLNASADSFYSSQGRKSESLIDDNEGLIAAIQKSHPKLSTLEMETFVLFHLALCAGYAAERKERDLGSKTGSLPRIESAAMQMIFVDRNSQGIITPSEVKLMEEWGGKAVCEALASISISADKTHPAENSVWAL